MAIQTLSPMTRRRRVDWQLILGPPGREPPAPKVVERSVRGQLAALLSAFDDILAVENSDAIIRRSVESARAKIAARPCTAYPPALPNPSRFST